MKKIFFLSFFLVPFLLCAQVFEDFQISRSINDYKWQGDLEAFEITENQSLRTKTINTIALSSPNTLALNAFWEFGIQLDFNPSPQNQLRIYLTSDHDSLKKPLNGYFILIGENGDTDRFHLYKQKGNDVSLILSSEAIVRPSPSQVNSRVKVTRDSTGIWNLYTAQADEDFKFEGSAFDNELRTSAYFGIHCRFTSSNSNKFQFNYFQIDTLKEESIVEVPDIEVPDIEAPVQKLKPSFTEHLLFMDTFESSLSQWDGEIEKFKIENHILRNAEEIASPSYIRTNNENVANRLWEFGLEVNGLLTTQNNVRIYLSADRDSLPGNQTGYYLQIDGRNSEHSYKFYRQTNGTRSLLWQSIPFPTIDDRLRARIRVTCSIDGEWRIYSDEYDYGEFSLLSSVEEDTSFKELRHPTSKYSGWMTRFSRTRVQDYSLHYFLIKELEFIEPRYVAKPYDVIINEIMANPNNSPGLPEVEYVELKNLSNEEIHLTGWTFASLSRSHIFTEGVIPPKSLLVIYNARDTISEELGNSLPISPWPPLVNSGTTLTLTNEEGLTIDEVTYSTKWYKDSQKSKGGWSLERIDPYLRCEDEDNWIASTDPEGGTPGRKNAVYQNTISQKLNILALEIVDKNQIHLSFNKMLDLTHASVTSNYHINNGIGSPDSVEWIDQKKLIIHYAKPFLEGYHYTLNIMRIADCVGVESNLNEEFFIPESIEPQDILINEVLADPFKGGVEFVELYNNSEKLLDISQLSIGTIRESDGTALLKEISNDPHHIPPHTYRLLSANSKAVLSQYPNSREENFIEMSSFPQLRNSHGTIVLRSGSNTIDSLAYHEDMHSILIKNTKGVSLERRSFFEDTNRPGNFTSASETAGFATPGYKNSQFSENPNQELSFSLRSKTFSPDHDGFEDRLEIDYFKPEDEEMMATIEIYNEQGRLVRKLTRNHRLSNEGQLYWDGLMDNSQLADVGIYVLVIELYNSKGFRKVFRKSCVLAQKF